MTFVSCVKPKFHGPIRIIHLVTRLPVAGLEKVVASLDQGMHCRRYISSIWCLEEADVLGRELQAEGRNVKELGKRCGRDLALFFRLAVALRSEKIDILHCHDELAWFYGAFSGWLGGVGRIICTIHGHRGYRSKRHLQEQKLLSRFTSAIVGVSDSVRQQVIEELRLRPEKVSVIHNGISLEPFRYSTTRRHRSRRALGIPESAILLGSVGRLDPVKNIEVIIEASARLQNLIPDLRVILVGEGPSQEQLARKVAMLGLKEKTIFLGLRNDISDLLAAVDIYICSSTTEGISLSVLEAMATERAVIATAVGGNLEVIQDRKTGILIKPGDPEVLAAAIIELSLDAGERSAIGQRARREVEANFSLQRMIKDYDKVYTSILESSYDKLEDHHS